MSLEAVRAAEGLQARGTLAREPAIVRPPPARRWRLLVEIGLLFILAPMLIRYAIFELHVPLFMVLQPLLLGFVLYLLWDPTFRLKRELAAGFPPRVLGWIVLLALGVGAVIAIFVQTYLPASFLALPTHSPRLWQVIMIAYPLLSVIPQELIYRTFFFHRYGPLFDNARWLAIAINGLLFGFAHIIFGSYISMGLTALLGFLLAWRYEETRSFWSVWLEHSIYGCLIFTIGLGHYFFTGVATLR